MKAHRHVGFERAVPTAMALVLVAACSGERDAGPNPHHGPDGGSRADASQASPDGRTDDDGGSAPSDANVDGGGFAGVLPGDPASPARAAITNVPAPPADDADIVDNVIMSRLDVWLQADATVGQVNTAVAGIGARVLSMTAGSSVISVAFPPAPDSATLEQKRQALEASPGIVFAALATVTVTENLPGGMAREERNIGHLLTARFPAAWNLRDIAIKNCESRKVNVIVLDVFGAPVPSRFEHEVPGFLAPKAASSNDHGWRVTSVAASYYDGEGVSGANPFTQCLNIRGVQAANISMTEANANLWQSLPSGKVIVNVSLAHSAPPNCANCSPSDFANGFLWLERGIQFATQWRELAHGRDDDLLIAESAGNNGNIAAGVHYALFRDARISGTFSLTASEQIFGSPRLTVFDDPAAFAPEPQFPGYPSLLPSADRRSKLLKFVTSHVSDDVGRAPNVVSVGATTRGEPLSVVQAPFSNSNGQVYAVGTAVMSVGAPDDSPVDGTSFSAPQVAGLASYLWLLSDDLRNKPTSFTRQAILENARFTVAAGVHVLDAYASVLSLDAAEPVTPASAPIRRALLDVNGDGAFTEADVQDFAAALVGATGQPPRVWDRHDLNGDGYSGAGTARFDLDRVGSLQYGLASYLPSVQQSYKGQTLTFDETALTDLQILCYYAYSALYTGAAAARDDKIGVACGFNPTADGGGADGGYADGGEEGPICTIGGVIMGGPGHQCQPTAVCANTDHPCCCPPLRCAGPFGRDMYDRPLYRCMQ